MTFSMNKRDMKKKYKFKIKSLILGILFLFLFMLFFLSDFLFAGSSDSSSTDEWLMFRRTLNHTSIYPGAIFIPEIGFTGAFRSLWDYQTNDDAYSSPAISKGIIFSASNDNYLYANNASYGGLIWRTNVSALDYSSPAISNGIVYIGGRYNVSALNLSNGIIIWESNGTSKNYFDSSPAVSNDIVYIGNYDGYVYALNATNGSLIWKNEDSSAGIISSSPIVVDDVLFINSAAPRGTIALNATNGSLIWSNNFPNSQYSSPTMIKGIVYIGGGSGPYGMFALNSTDGSQIWNYSISTYVSSSPAVKNDVVYFGSHDHNFYALNATNGSQIWSYGMGGNVFSSPSIANDLLFIGGNYFYIFNITSKSNVDFLSESGVSWYSSSPAIADGIVYIENSNNYLYAYIPVSFAGGSGTSADPYQIENCTQLQSIFLSADFILNNDINCSETINWNGGSGFDDIPLFMGNLNGNNHTINDLFKNDSYPNSGGIFYVLAGTVENLGLKNANIIYNGASTAYGTGGIAAGLVDGNITNSYVTGNVSGKRYVGGIVGSNYGNISQSYSNATIIGGENHVGGLVGLLGDGNITNSYSTGNVTGVLGVGGLVGTIDGGIIEDSYSIGYIIGTAGYIGGLVGFENSAGTISNSFWDNQTSGQITSVGGTGKNTTDMKRRITYTDAGWNLYNLWIVNPSNDIYPYFRNQGFIGGDGTSNNPYQISTCTQLQNISDNINNILSLSYILNNSINCTETINWNSGAGFTPIGNSTSGYHFSGEINGDGYTIDNLFINRSSVDNQGLFGYLEGNITKIGLKNINILGNLFVGGLVGTNYNGNISLSYTIGNITGTSGVGGFIGTDVSTKSSFISNSYSKANITGRYAGGLIGFAGNYLNMNNSYAMGNITGKDGYPTGGLSASFGGIISNSFWDNQTSGQTTSDGGTGKTTAEMKIQSTFTNWDFVDLWKLDSTINNGYPYLIPFYVEFTSSSTNDGNFSKNSIDATAKSKIENLDTIIINLYNSTDLVQSNSSNTLNPLSINFTSLSDEWYYLNATVNDTSNNLFSTGTRTILLDTQAPSVTINEPTNKTSRTLDYNVTLSDNFGYETCIYWVKRGINFEISNTTVTCGNNIGGSFIVTLDADYTFYFFVNDSTGNINLSSSSFSVSPISNILSGAGGVTIINITEEKTHCGDLICHDTGNDYGIQENYWNCPIDCPGAVGENLDTLVFSLSSYCWDKDPSTVCLWEQMFSIIPGTEVTETTFSGKINGDTLFLNCFNKSGQCFWNTNIGAISLFIGVGVIFAIFMVKPFSVKGKKTNFPRYVVVKLKGKKKRK